MDGSGSGSGLAPFLMKTYEMVDDKLTDEIVSWSDTNNSFIVWNPTDFSSVLLPTYFRHNNFSSFIRQLNTYGFRKIHNERWEFANEDFVKDQKHLLKNIHRKKPTHNHSHPPAFLVDPERSAFEQEIEKLSHEKTAIESIISGFKQNLSAAKLHLGDLQQRLDAMEKRQKNLLNLFETGLQNPTFVEQISRKIESMDLLGYNKKRRLPQVDHLQPVAENSFLDNDGNFGLGFGNIFDQDFSNKLRLELSPAISDITLISPCAQCANEDGESLHKMLSEGEPKEVETITAFGFAPETLEHTDTGPSFTFDMDSCLSRRETAIESPKLHSLDPNSEEGDCDHISCLLDLTLAPSPISQVKRDSYTDRSPQIGWQEIGKSVESIFHASDKESDGGATSNGNLANEVTYIPSSQEPPSNNQGTPAAPIRVNDAFWEQFLNG